MGVSDESGSVGLAGRRVLVVGASSGIGRAVAAAAATAGARVAVAARRYDLLRELEREAHGVTVALHCDVRAPVACELVVKAAVQRLGGLDAVVFATGINRLARLEDTTLDLWRELFDTNVVGAALVTRAALDSLRQSRGRIAYLSSHSVAAPWPALGAYAASKAALDTMIAAWRTEEPSVCFTRVVVGPTITGMADGWEPDLATEMLDRWRDEGYLTHEPARAEWVAQQVVSWASATDPPQDVNMIDKAGA